jgi:hypothetical protein
VSGTTVPRYERLADRQSIFAVWIGHPNAGSVLTGYVRLDDQILWVARTLGSAPQAADIRRLHDRYAASVWFGPTPSADRCHVRTWTVRVGLTERGS